MSEPTIHKQDDGREWDKPYLPPPWSAVQNDETGLWEVVCDGYDDETPIVCAGTKNWPLSEADAQILAGSLEMMERLQAIIDWADLALKMPGEFDSHGVRNLDCPVFDAAREVLARLSPAPAAQEQA